MFAYVFVCVFVCVFSIGQCLAFSTYFSQKTKLTLKYSFKKFI